MTNEHERTEDLANHVSGDDSVRDEALVEALQGAYESMDPTPEQESRMLETLMAAQKATDAFPSKDLGGGASAGGERPQGKAASNRNRSFTVWKIAAPLAACVALGAVLVGVANTLPTPASQVASQASSVESSQASTQAPIQASAQSSNHASSQATALSQSSASSANAASAKTAGDEEPDVVDVEILDEGEELGMVEMAADAYTGAAMETSGYIDDGYPYPEVELNTEEYDAMKEPGFISTKSRPLSTVSADVDTASYCNVRRMVNDGLRAADLPSGAVRIEEMINYFDYGYALPKGSDLFSMQAQSAPCPWNADTQLLVLGFAAAPENQTATKGSNLVFLIDVSGSMDSSDKLDLLQDSFATLLESLGPDDRISIVTYASGEEIVLEGASGDDDKAILKAIYKLHANGSTNGEAGLAQAYEVAQRNFIEGGVNRIIMASDGDLNVGMTSESDLYDFVDAKRESGIYLSVLGFGTGNYKDNKMETLADHGNGSYHYIDCIEEAQRVLKEKLTANLVPFADDVKVQVEFNPAQVKAYRLIGYENRSLADEDFRNDEVDAGDVGPGAQFTVAYEIVLSDSPFKVDEPDLKYGPQAQPYGNESGDWLTCTMRYHAFDGDEMREQQLVADAASMADQPDADWSLTAAVIEFGMLARGSDYAGTASLDGVLDLLSAVKGNDQADSFRRLAMGAL